MVRAQATVQKKALAFDGFEGREVVERILEAYAFAQADPYRAATHNKGIMNGVDGLALATGNDWRAIEAAAHAYAARNGCYNPLTSWHADEEGNLRGSIELPISVGIVGGATQANPTAKVALKILGVKSASELSRVMAAVGLAQNLAALRALATEGIQRGHMALHARNVALSVGVPEEYVDQVVDQMVDERKIRPDRAQEIVKELKSSRR
jgi:hydroxymethylglutaryl-CoA reductase